MFFLHSNSLIVGENTLKINKKGLKFERSHHSVVYNNSIYQHLAFGIELFQSVNCTATFNDLRICRIGFFIHDGSNDSTITYNLLFKGLEGGVWMVYWSHEGETVPSNNTVHHNTFFDNQDLFTAHEARDDFNNSWFDAVLLEGNY